MRWLLLTLLIGLPVLAQVMLPTRRIVAPTPAAVAPFSNIDCGEPPVSTNLVAWWCFQSLRTQIPGITTGTEFTNLADISPAQVNGLYWNAAVGFNNRKPKYTTPGANGRDFAVFGSFSADSVLINSNAWWSGITEAEIVWVIAPGVQSSISWDAMTADRVNNAFLKDASANTFSAFGSTARKNAGNIGIYDGTGNLLSRINIYTAAGDWGIYTNGVLAFSTAVNTVGWPASASLGYVTMNATDNSTFVANVYEILVFTNKLTSGQRSSVDAWLASKYGL